MTRPVSCAGTRGVTAKAAWIWSRGNSAHRGALVALDGEEFERGREDPVLVLLSPGRRPPPREGRLPRTAVTGRAGLIGQGLPAPLRSAPQGRLRARRSGRLRRGLGSS